MAKTYENFATVVVADTDTEALGPGAGETDIVTEFTVCNIGSTAQTFRVAVIDGDLGDVANQDYKFYDTPIEGNQSIPMTPKWNLKPTHTLLVRASHANVVFSGSYIAKT